MEIAQVIIGQCLTVLENVIVLDFVVKVLGWKENVIRRKVCFGAVCVPLLMISQFNAFLIPYSFAATITADIIIICLFAGHFLQGQRQMQIFWCLVPFIIVTIGSTLMTQIIESLVAESARGFIGGGSMLLMVSAMLSKLFLYVVLSLIRKMVNGRMIRLTRLHWMMTNTLNIIVLIIEYLLLQTIYLENVSQNVKVMLILVSVSFGMLSIYVCYAVFVIGDRNEKVLRYEIAQMQKSEVQRQIQEIKQEEFKIRCLRHDYNNHCLDMQYLLDKKEYDQLRMYLEKLSGRYLKEDTDSIQTHNPFVDAVVNRAFVRCRECKTDLICTITGNISGLTGIEAAIILFNLLDNAVEACEKVKDGGKIELTVRSEAGGYNLFLKNTTVSPVLQENRYFRSDKKEKDLHGIGHFSVEDAVEESGGMLEYYEEGDFFCTHVFLPDKQSIPDLQQTVPL